MGWGSRVGARVGAGVRVPPSTLCISRYSLPMSICSRSRIGSCNYVRLRLCQPVAPQPRRWRVRRALHPFLHPSLHPSGVSGCVCWQEGAARGGSVRRGSQRARRYLVRGAARGRVLHRHGEALRRVLYVVGHVRPRRPRRLVVLRRGHSLLARHSAPRVQSSEFIRAESRKSGGGGV